MRRLRGARELLDGPLDARLLEGNLRDLARMNTWLGGAALTWRALQPTLREPRPGSQLRFLDVGTGGGDIPRALRRAAAHRSPGLSITATDTRPEIVAVARRAGQRQPRFDVRLASPERIAADDRSFDIVHSSLVIHHLEPTDAVAMLREMARVASRAVIVNDLDRAGRWLLAARLLTTLATRNRYTRHDAPLSVLRAYRPSELVQLAARAGLVEEARYWAWPGYRYAITFRHGARR